MDVFLKGKKSYIITPREPKDVLKSILWIHTTLRCKATKRVRKNCVKHLRYSSALRVALVTVRRAPLTHVQHRI